MRGEPTTYWDYLHLPDLLNLQHGIDTKDSELAQDEIHFIMVHQVFELWFKLTLHELRLASRELAVPGFDPFASRAERREALREAAQREGRR